MRKFYTCSFSDKHAYIFDGESVKIVEIATGEEVFPKDLGVRLPEVIEDASKAYIKNDLLKMKVEEQNEPDESCNCNGFCDDHECACRGEECQAEDIETEVKDPEGVAAFHEQIESKGFGDYLIVIGDYSEADFDIFTGSKQGLNDHIDQLNLHEAPKVYALKQLQVIKKYTVK